MVLAIMMAAVSIHAGSSFYCSSAAAAAAITMALATVADAAANPFASGTSIQGGTAYMAVPFPYEPILQNTRYFESYNSFICCI